MQNMFTNLLTPYFSWNQMRKSNIQSVETRGGGGGGAR